MPSPINPIVTCAIASPSSDAQQPPAWGAPLPGLGLGVQGGTSEQPRSQLPGSLGDCCYGRTTVYGAGVSFRYLCKFWAQKSLPPTLPFLSPSSTTPSILPSHSSFPTSLFLPLSLLPLSFPPFLPLSLHIAEPLSGKRDTMMSHPLLPLKGSAVWRGKQLGPGCLVLRALRESCLEQVIPVLNPDRFRGAGQERKWTRINPPGQICCCFSFLTGLHRTSPAQKPSLVGTDSLDASCHRLLGNIAHLARPSLQG